MHKPYTTTVVVPTFLFYKMYIIMYILALYYKMNVCKQYITSLYNI